MRLLQIETVNVLGLADGSYPFAKRGHDALESATISTFAGLILAHELGHMLGATASLGGRAFRFPMPDGGGTGPYMNQDAGGHDLQNTVSGLMVAGEHWPHSQALGLPGPERAFRPIQRAYLAMVSPKADDFAPGEA